MKEGVLRFKDNCTLSPPARHRPKQRGLTDGSRGKLAFTLALFNSAKFC